MDASYRRASHAASHNDQKLHQRRRLSHAARLYQAAPPCSLELGRVSGLQARGSSKGKSPSGNDFLTGQLSAEEDQAVSEHVEQCQDCVARIGRFEQEETVEILPPSVQGARQALRDSLRAEPFDANAMRAAMAEASRGVLGGFELSTSVHLTRYPDRFFDPGGRGGKMWHHVMGLITKRITLKEAAA